ncbi:HAD-IA family hydrolase [Sulfitobacter sp. JB4-11]|uniref:HAD-IA family hydrolase n=1 Tax=Sulfitobacter rhodophyticola TaxID=3238304 RepID=UPI0035176822
MTTPLRLVIFDVDGTLVDSQGDILAAMAVAFETVGHPLPAREQVLAMVGLSLEVIFPTLVPDADAATHARMVQRYKDAYVALRAEGGVARSSPLYPGARQALEALHAVPEVLLGVATGKSRRGLDKLIEGHGLQGLFVTQHCADFHPSKPHPSMILGALSDTGVAPRDAIMVGDTSFDMEMAAGAGVAGVGVSWGYHDAARLGAFAHTVVDDFDGLQGALNQVWGQLA